jgi:hypothetical protein
MILDNFYPGHIHTAAAHLLLVKDVAHSANGRQTYSDYPN